jgi:hypothetical protein
MTKTVLKGQRNAIIKLWAVPIATHALESDNSPPKIEHRALNVNLSTKLDDLVAFAHGAMFSPSIFTLKQALRCNFITIAGLRIENLTKQPLSVIATAKTSP